MRCFFCGTEIKQTNLKIDSETYKVWVDALGLSRCSSRELGDTFLNHSPRAQLRLKFVIAMQDSDGWIWGWMRLAEKQVLWSPIGRDYGENS